VAVLREALTRDEVARRRAQQEKVRKGKVANSVRQFIQNVHHFRDDALSDEGQALKETQSHSSTRYSEKRATHLTTGI
jgi:hypothetical protein